MLNRAYSSLLPKYRAIYHLGRHRRWSTTAFDSIRITALDSRAATLVPTVSRAGRSLA